MRKRLPFLLLFLAGVLTGCGDSNTFVPQPGDPGGGPIDPGTPVAASLQMLTSNPQMPSDGSAPVTITALTLDANNNFISGVDVIFAADTGGLVVTQGTTDANGAATATLSVAGNPTPRTITVTGTAGTVGTTVTVNVTGTTLSITGPGTLASGDTGTYTVLLRNAGGSGIAGESVDVTSASGSTLDPVPPYTTDSTGQVQFDATVTASDTLTASVLGLTAVKDITIPTGTGESFTFVAPTANTEIDLNVPEALTVRLLSTGNPVVGETISFSTTRGTLSAFTAVTDNAGEATVSVQANNAGGATVTATNESGVPTSLAIEFVATTPSKVEVQANPFTIAPNETSAVTAIVRDANDNLVKNRSVNFTLEDTTGGQLSVGSAITDSQGRAQTTYTASDTISDKDGVKITAAVAGTALVDEVYLTVAGREVFITLGTGNEIEEPNQAQYKIQFVVQVTDSQGNGVSGVTVVMSLLSELYTKGYWSLPLTGDWIQIITIDPPDPVIGRWCLDEDANRNGILDAPEDFNGSGQIEAGNIATVVPGTATTDASGFALIDVLYPQQFARWVQVVLEARTAVQGTEFSSNAHFVLPIAASDVAADTNPPGNPSPFGQSTTCLDTN